MRIKFFQFLYNFLLLSGLLSGGWLLLPLILASSKRRQTILYRLGIKAPSEIAVGPSKPVWVHALSVGEVIAALPLVQELQTRFPERPLVISASTLTGYEIAVKHFSHKAAGIVYFPYDLPFCVKTISRRVNPALMIIIETDIWPNFLHHMQKYHVPVILANARISEKALRTYLRFGFFTQLMFGAFTTVCLQSQADVSRFARLGVAQERLIVCGNIKFEARSIPISDFEPEHFRKQLNLPAGLKIVVAGSTHPGEETILLKAWGRLKRAQPDVFLIIAPRDPRRAESVRILCREAGFFAKTLEQWSKNEKSASGKIPDILIVDAIGMLKKLYAIAHIAFIGGSLVDCGGHNPLEAAVFAKPILFGPDMSDFALIRDKLSDARAALQVHDADSLYDAFILILTDLPYAHQMGCNAYRLLRENRGAVARTTDVAVKCLAIEIKNKSDENIYRNNDKIAAESII